MPWLFWLQLSCKYPSEEPSPFTSSPGAEDVDTRFNLVLVTAPLPNLASITDPLWRIALVTVLLLGVPMFTVEPRTIAK